MRRSFSKRALLATAVATICYMAAGIFILDRGYEESVELIENRIAELGSDLSFISQLSHFRQSLELVSSTTSRVVFQKYMDSRRDNLTGSAIKALYVYDTEKKEIVSYLTKRSSPLSYSVLSHITRASDPLKNFISEGFLYVTEPFESGQYTLTAAVAIAELVRPVKGISTIRMAYWGEPVAYGSWTDRIVADSGNILAISIAYLLALAAIFNLFCLCRVSKGGKHD